MNLNWPDLGTFVSWATVFLSVMLNIQLWAWLHEQLERNRDLALRLQQLQADRSLTTRVLGVGQQPHNGRLSRLRTHGDTFIRRSK